MNPREFPNSDDCIMIMEEDRKHEYALSDQR